jgi:hypothetical protein
MAVPKTPVQRIMQRRLRPRQTDNNARVVCKIDHFLSAD